MPGSAHFYKKVIDYVSYCISQQSIKIGYCIRYSRMFSQRTLIAGERFTVWLQIPPTKKICSYGQDLLRC